MHDKQTMRGYSCNVCGWERLNHSVPRLDRRRPGPGVRLFLSVPMWSQVEGRPFRARAALSPAPLRGLHGCFSCSESRWSCCNSSDATRTYVSDASACRHCMPVFRKQRDAEVCAAAKEQKLRQCRLTTMIKPDV